MLLRASGRHSGDQYDFGAINGTAAADGGIPHGLLLRHYAEAVLGRVDVVLAWLRAEVTTRLGPAALVDAAAVIGLFNAIDRVADATGIPLEPEKAAGSVELRAELGIGKYEGGTAIGI